MSKMIEKRRLEFIPQSEYGRLNEEVRDKLLSYRRLYSKIVRKEGKINNLKRTIDKEKLKLKEMKKDLTSQNEWIDHLRKKYSFSCSLVSLKPRKSGKVYYNLSISRGGITKPKNVSLGSEEIITNQLKEYYKGRSKKLKELKEDWKQFVKDETNFRFLKIKDKFQFVDGEIYIRILRMIIKNPLGFSEEMISRDTLFPLKEKKGKTKK
ncbi:MAG: hypothetical protein H8E55_52590 [Pelagibacterales bacterium]|nr:hypothetical protein [Pelagibacterales bacterium]